MIVAAIFWGVAVAATWWATDQLVRVFRGRRRPIKDDFGLWRMPKLKGGWGPRR